MNDTNTITNTNDSSTFTWHMDTWYTDGSVDELNDEFDNINNKIYKLTKEIDRLKKRRNRLKKQSYHKKRRLK